MTTRNKNAEVATADNVGDTVWGVYYDRPRGFGVVYEVSAIGAEDAREGQCKYVFDYPKKSQALAHLELIEKQEMLKADGITQLISDKLGVDIEMPPHLSSEAAYQLANDFEEVIYHSINLRIDELMKEVNA